MIVVAQPAQPSPSRFEGTRTDLPKVAQESTSSPNASEGAGVSVQTEAELTGAAERQARDNHHTDAALIQSCLTGDREAWALLLERYSGLVYSTAWNSNLSPEDVADVYQSVVLVLLEELEDLRDWTRLGSWLTTVTIRECIRVKRRRTRSLPSFEEVETEIHNIPDEAALPDEVVQRLEKQQLVQQALSMMDEPCRSLLTKLFFEKDLWSYEQIADELGVAVSTVGPKRSRCLKKLLQHLTQLGL